jgi:hypothetical protein
MTEEEPVVVTHQSLVKKELTVKEHRAAKKEYLQKRMIRVKGMM